MSSHSGPPNPNNPSMASRQRLRWTHELHERFVDAVTQLGGPDSEYSLFQPPCLMFTNGGNNYWLKICETMNVL